MLRRNFLRSTIAGIITGIAAVIPKPTSVWGSTQADVSGPAIEKMKEHAYWLGYQHAQSEAYRRAMDLEMQLMKAKDQLQEARLNELVEETAARLKNRYV